MSTVLIPNFIAIVLLLVLLFSTNRASHYTMLFDSRIFELMVLCNFLQSAGEIITYSIDGILLPGIHTLSLLFNAMLFFINICFSYLWVVYADYKIFEDLARVKKRSKTLGIPALAVAVGSVLNLFFPVFFQITQDNVYQRTALYVVPFLVTYFYLIYGTVFIYRYKSQARKYLFLPAAVFMFPIFLGSGVQFFFYGYSTVWVGVAIALVALYVNVQNEMSYTDGHSGLYTRIYMHQYLENALRNKSSDTKLAVIMLDIDEFKKINDTFGHLTGDDAIRSTGKILRSPTIDCILSARYGGDEFVVLLQARTEADVEKTLMQIHQAEETFNRIEGKCYTLNFSMGYTLMDPSTDSIDAFLERMDHAMYEVKKSRKHRTQSSPSPVT